jgi:putative hemolysin
MKFVWIFLSITFLFYSYLFAYGQEQSNSLKEDSKIANPASVYCVEVGGRVVIRKDKAGNEYGICVFKDGKECDEWALLRGQCPIGGMRKKAYKDPFEYCEDVKTVDKPDSRYKGYKTPESIIQAMIRQGIVSADAPESFKKSFVWRCMNWQVFVCHFGANIPCLEKADLGKEPTQAMKDFCKSNPNSDFIPAVATGRITIYEWRCKNDKPVAVKNVLDVDVQGYIANFWHELN